MPNFSCRSVKAFALIGVTAALLFGIAGSLSMRRTTSRIEKMDAEAQPYFDEAAKNVPAVVAQLTRTRSFCKICWLMIRDKCSGSRKTQEYLASVLQKPILSPCQKGAEIYGCNFETEHFLRSLQEVNAAYAGSGAYAIGGLAMEAIFLKTTFASLRAVLGSVLGKLAATYAGGAACALADGPFPFGDAIGVLMSVGGTAWCCYDLYQLKKELPNALNAALLQAISDCQQACRNEALR